MPSWDTDVNIKPQSVFTETVGFTTLISEGEDKGGKERRRSKGSAVYLFNLAFDILTLTECNTIWNFYIARKGDTESFTWTSIRDSVLYTVRFYNKDLTREWIFANNHKLTLKFKKVPA